MKNAVKEAWVWNQRWEKDDPGDKCKVIQPKTKIFVGRKIN